MPSLPHTLSAVSQQHGEQCITTVYIGLRLLHGVMPAMFCAYGPDVLSPPMALLYFAKVIA